MSVRRLEVIVSGVLRLGVALSGLLISSGMALLLWSGDISCPYGILSLEWVLLGDPFLQPSHVMFLGFLVLVSTPVIRVAVSVANYVLERDWLYAVITGFVLTVLIAGMFLGLG
jgi:uncharacterized membrane protein